MSGFTASILEDYDHDAIPPLTEDELNKELGETEQLEQTIGRLFATQRSIGNFGLTPSAKLLLGTTGLLAANDVGLESSGSWIELTESTALEALGNKLKETAAKWADKIMRIAKGGAQAIINALTPIYTAVTQKVNAVTTKAGALITDGVAYAKAHPYKTILAALGAVAATVTIVGFVGASFPSLGATNGAMATFMTKLRGMFQAIKLPFGKVTTSTVLNGEAIVAGIEVTEAATTSAAPLSALGWTVSTTKTVGAQLGRIWTSLIGGLGTLGNKALTIVKKVLSSPLVSPKELGEAVSAKTGSPVTGWISQQVLAAQYMRMIFKIIPNVFHFVGQVVRQVLQMVKETFAGLSHPQPKAA